MNLKKQDSCGFCKELGHPYTYCSHRKEHTKMGAECVLCNNNNIFSRLRDRIERVVPINNMKKSV